MEYYFFFTWILFMAVIIGKIAFAHYQLKRKLKLLKLKMYKPFI